MESTQPRDMRQPALAGDPALLAYAMVRRLRRGRDVDPFQISNRDYALTVAALRALIINTPARVET